MRYASPLQMGHFPYRRAVEPVSQLKRVIADGVLIIVSRHAIGTL